MSDDYPYINARIRGMKGRLLSAKDYEAALGTSTLTEVISLLDNTPYGPEVEKALTLKKGIAGLEEGLRRSLEQNFTTIQKMTSGHPRELIEILMSRWELLNIKTVLRGKHVNATLEDILANLAPIGELDDIALRELANQKNIKGVIDLLRQWRLPYAIPLRKAYSIYLEKEDLQMLELALDKAHFGSVISLLDSEDFNDTIVLEIIRREIDVILITYALRVVHYGVRETEASKIFIPGGKEIGAAKFEAMLVTRDIDSLIKTIDVHCYNEALEASMINYLKDQKLSVLERSLEIGFIRNTCRVIHHDPLSISVVIAYLWLKVNEIINLRIISRGKFTSMPREDIEKMLVLI